MLLGMKHKHFLPLIRHDHVTVDETQTIFNFNKTPTMLLGMKQTQAILTFNKTPTMLLGMKHKEFLPLIRHQTCYWG